MSPAAGSRGAPWFSPVGNAAFVVLPKQDVRAGSTVQIGGCGFCIAGLLSHGSFGAVWVASHKAASGSAEGNVVIKEILCRARNSLHAAEFEGEILRQCANWVRAGEIEERVPALLAEEKESIGPECWRVRLAMTRIPGEPLDDFIEHHEVAGVAPGEPGPRLARAVSLARELLTQLGAAMGQISTRVYHRDVHPRNMLVEERAGGGPPRFGLVDFGLSVAAGPWRGGGWRERGAGGDCRYWPTSAWVVFGQGAAALDEQPALRREYETRLDFHALGLSALEVLVRLAPRPPPASAPEETPPAGAEAPPPSGAVAALQGLRAAWEKYWEDVSRFWEVVYGAYTGGKDIGELKAACVDVGVHAVVAAGLRQVREALRELRGASGGSAKPAAGSEAEDGGLCGSAAGDLPALVDALLQLISDGEEPEDDPTWGGVCALFAEPAAAAKEAAPPPPRPPVHERASPVGRWRAVAAEALSPEVQGREVQPTPPPSSPVGAGREILVEAPPQSPASGFRPMERSKARPPKAEAPPQSPLLGSRSTDRGKGRGPLPESLPPAEARGQSPKLGFRSVDKSKQRGAAEQAAQMPPQAALPVAGQGPQRVSRKGSRKVVKLSDEVIVATITAPSTPKGDHDAVEYYDDDGDLVCFRLEGGKLVNYCNGKRGVGVGNTFDTSGVVTELKWFCTDMEGWGGSIADQFNCGGMVPRGKLEPLRALADRAGVPNTIPTQTEEPETLKEDPLKVDRAQSITPDETASPGLEPEPEATPTHTMPQTPRSPPSLPVSAPAQRQPHAPWHSGPASLKFQSSPMGPNRGRAPSPTVRSMTPQWGAPPVPAAAARPSRGSSARVAVSVGSPQVASRPVPGQFAPRAHTPSRPPPSVPVPGALSPQAFAPGQGLSMTMPVWRPGPSGCAAAAAPPPRASVAAVQAAGGATPFRAPAMSRSPPPTRRVGLPPQHQAAHEAAQIFQL